MFFCFPNTDYLVNTLQVCYSVVDSMAKPVGAKARFQESALPSKWAWLQGGLLVPLDVEVAVHFEESPDKANGASVKEEGTSVPIVLEPLREIEGLDLSESVSVPLTVESALVGGLRNPWNGLT